MKKLQCENCGAALTVNEEEWTATCEYCGTTIMLPEPSPVEEMDKGMIYEQKTIIRSSKTGKKLGIGITLFVIVFILTVASIITFSVFYMIDRTNTGYYEIENAEYSWPTTGLATLIPEPATDNGKIEEDSAEHFSSVFYDVTQQDFDSYATKCKEMGFSVEAEGSDSGYSAYSSDGSLLELYYWAEEQELSVYIDAPENMAELIWPKDGLAAKLPKPASEKGNILWGDEENISIVVYMDSKEEFEQYKDSCIAYGFAENYEYSFSDQKYGWYEADNKDGYHLNLDYEDRFYKKMRIHLEKE